MCQAQEHNEQHPKTRNARRVLALTAGTDSGAAPAAQHGTAVSARRISGSSRRRIATRGSGPNRSWTRWGSPKASVVADLGAGGGWFTIRLARSRRAERQVYAEDVQPQMIEAIKRRIEREGLKNVKTVLGTPTDPQLPAPVDAVLIVDAYHEMEQPVALLRNVAQVAQAERPHRHRRVQEGRRRSRAADGGARRSRAGDPRRRGRRPAPASRGELPALPVHAGVRHAADNDRGSRVLRGLPGAVDAELRRLVPDDGDAVARSMAYTVLAPSKRVRPVLTLLRAELCGGAPAARRPGGRRRWSGPRLVADPRRSAVDGRCAAAARTAGQSRGVRRSHRDPRGVRPAQPCLRRARARYEPPLAARLSALLSDAVGTDGLIGGQAADLLATDQQISFEMLERIHRGKTGALFGAAATAGAITAGAAGEAIASLAAYAKNLGLAFQIIDDLLDVEGDPAETGKAVREDAQEDDVRVVQRRRRARGSSRGALPDRRSRAGSRSAAAPTGCASCRRSSRPRDCSDVTTP